MTDLEQARSDYEAVLIDAMSAWAEVRYLKSLLKRVAENDDLRYMNDEGPVHEGWQSESLMKLWADIDEAIK